MEPPLIIQRTVNFDLAVRVHASLALSDFSEEEKYSYWYSNDDLEDIQCEVIATLDLMEMNEFIEDEENCARGLESRTQRAMESRAVNRASAFEAISREYFLLKHYGENAAGLRSMCWEIFVRDEEAARLRAVIDEEEAFLIFLEDATANMMMERDSTLAFDMHDCRVENGNFNDYQECDEECESLTSPTRKGSPRHVMTDECLLPSPSTSRKNRSFWRGASIS
jgi:hypothetical protein